MGSWQAEEKSEELSSQCSEREKCGDLDPAGMEPNGQWAARGHGTAARAQPAAL